MLWSGTIRFMLDLALFNRLPLARGDDGSGHPSICLLKMDLAAGAGVPFIRPRWATAPPLCRRGGK